MAKIKIPSIDEIRRMKIDLNVDIGLLDLIIGFLKRNNITKTRKVLNNMYKLFNMLNEELYKDNNEISSRIWIIKFFLKRMVDDNLHDSKLIYQEMKEDPNCNDLIKEIYTSISDSKVNYETSKSIIRLIDDRVEYGYVMTIKNVIKSLINEIDDGDYKSYKNVADKLQEIAQSLISINRNTRNIDSETTFSLRTEMFENVVKESVQKLKDKQKVFMTGIQALNAILSPGYLAKRLYMYLAFPAGGKSQTLLKAALDIRKYNSPITPKNPDNTPAVLFLTMENDIDETIERMYNMLVDDDDIRNYTEKQIINRLRTEGGLTLTDKNNIDIIIKYFPNRSISTNDLYTIIQDFEDSGTEIIALVLDYVKRIRPTEKAGSEKEELKNITNELKTLAKNKEIPVITAQQLNRVASTTVDAAITANKQDVTRLVGKDGVAGAWEIIENSDVVIVINQEVKQDTRDLYLTFKLLKRRYKATTYGKFKKLEYFNHPYAKDSTIKLIDDIDLPEPLSSISLSTTFVPTENKHGKISAVERDKIDKVEKKNKKSSQVTIDEYTPFNFEEHNN